MNTKNIKALVIDDNVFKINDICKALNECGINNIIQVDNQEDAFEEIYRSMDDDNGIKLVVTDMHYPVKKGDDADTRSGFIFVERMKSENIDIPIIICSSLNFEAPEVAGVVWYSKIRDLREDFMEALRGI